MVSVLVGFAIDAVMIAALAATAWLLVSLRARLDALRMDSSPVRDAVAELNGATAAAHGAVLRLRGATDDAEGARSRMGDLSESLRDLGDMIDVARSFSDDLAAKTQAVIALASRVEAGRATDDEETPPKDSFGNVVSIEQRSRG